jgi:hypothetical protein
MTERTDTVTVIARALCSSMRGRGSSACFCHGDLKNCHAATLYQDFATAALYGLERAGYTVSKPGFVEFHDAPTIEAACDTVDQLAREMAETLGNALDEMRATWPESPT